MVICLERRADLHMAQLMPLPLTSLASILPFWYRLTQIVPEKGPLKAHTCVLYFCTCATFVANKLYHYPPVCARERDSMSVNIVHDQLSRFCVVEL